ncbi:class I SAM-dependent methyltransferase [Caballeronia sp. EK]|nr:class I SAM-dependent methyltransferase [Caballeronia sp. EK]
MADAENTSNMAYSQFARRYAEIALTKPHNALYERPATMALLGNVNGLRVLDAGCGPGICSEHLAHNGASVHAFDVTPEIAELARTRCRGLPVDVTEGDLAAPLNWLSDQSFDKILCSLAFDYLEDLKPALNEFRRVANEAPRVFRRLQFLRKWSYGKHEEEVTMVLAGSS